MIASIEVVLIAGLVAIPILLVCFWMMRDAWRELASGRHRLREVAPLFFGCLFVSGCIYVYSVRGISFHPVVLIGLGLLTFCAIVLAARWNDLRREFPANRASKIVFKEVRIWVGCVAILVLIVTVGVWFQDGGESKLRQKLGQAKAFFNVKQDAPEANQFATTSLEDLRVASQGGDAKAQVELGQRYRTGKADRQDQAEAVQWFRKAAETGNASGKYFLGEMLESGQGVQRNQQEAVKWFRAAAEQDLAPAQRKMGELHLKGEGVGKNEHEAVRWFRKAADSGDSAGKYFLGEMLESGQGLQRDQQEAVKWFRSAAEQGYTHAQRKMGELYSTGVGVPKDEQEAVKWFLRMAADSGNEQAKIELAAISPSEPAGIQQQAETVRSLLNKSLLFKADTSQKKNDVARAPSELLDQRAKFEPVNPREVPLNTKRQQGDTPGATVRWFRESADKGATPTSNAIIGATERREKIELPSSLFGFQNNSISVTRTMEIMDSLNSKQLPIDTNDSVPASAVKPAVAVALDGGFKFLKTKAKGRSKLDYQITGTAYVVANEAFLRLIGETPSIYWNLVITPGPRFTTTAGSGPVVFEEFHNSGRLLFRPTRFKGIYCAVVTFEGKKTTPGFLDRDLVITGTSPVMGSTLVSFTCGVHHAGTSKFYNKE